MSKIKLKKKKKQDTIYDYPLNRIQGMFPNGGRTPIKGTKEQYQAYQDSLDLYTKGKELESLAEPLVKNISNEYNRNKHFWNSSAKFSLKKQPYFSQGFSSDIENRSDYQKSTNEQYNNFINSQIHNFFSTKPNIKPINTVVYSTNVPVSEEVGGHFTALVPEYIKPVQPIIYQPDSNKITLTPQEAKAYPSTIQRNGKTYKVSYISGGVDEIVPLKEQTINIQSSKPDLLQGNNQQLEFNPIGFQKGTYFTRPQQSQETGGLEYFDKVTGKKLMQNGGSYQEFLAWKSKLPQNLQNERDYDLQGAWHDNLKPSQNLHLPDTYKLPNHPTFSDESVYFNPQTQKYAGHWNETDSSWNYMPYDTNYKKMTIEHKRDGGFTSLPQIFADGGVNQYDVPARMVQDEKFFQLPYNEIATALLSKQKAYDEQEAEMAKNQAFLADLKSGYRTAGLPQEIQKDYNDKFQSYVGQDLTKPEIKRAFVGDIARLKSDPRLRTLAADIKQSALWDNYQQAHPDLAGAAVNPYNINGQWTPAKDAQGNWQSEDQVNNWYGNITPYSDFNKMIDDSYGKVKENTISKIKESNPSAEFHTDADGKAYYTTTTTGFKKNYIDATLPQWKDAAKETAFNIKNSNLPEAKYFRGTFQNEINQNPNFVEDYVSTAGGKFMYNRTETSEKNDIHAGGSGSGSSNSTTNNAQPREVTQILKQNTAIPKGELPTQVIKNYQNELKTTFDNYEKQGFATDVDADGFKFLAPKPGETIAETSTRESNNNELKLLQQKQANALDIHKALAEKHGFDPTIDLEKQVKDDKVKQEILQIQAQAQAAKNTSLETRKIMEAAGEPEEKIKAQIDSYNAQVDKSTTYRMQQAIKKDPAFKSYMNDLEALQEGIQESGTLAYPITGEKYQATRDNVKSLLLDKTNYKVGDQGSIEYLQSNKDISDDDKAYINKYITEKGKDALEGVSSLLWDRENGEYAVLVDIPRDNGENIHLKVSQKKLPTLPTISKGLDNLYNDFDRQVVRDNYQSYENKTDENHGILQHPDLSKAIVTTHVPTEEKLPGGKLITQGQTVFTLPELPNVLLRMNSFDRMYDFLTYYNNPQNAGAIKDPQQLLQAARQYSLEDIAVPDNIYKRYEQKIKTVAPKTSPK